MYQISVNLNLDPSPDACVDFSSNAWKVVRQGAQDDNEGIGACDQTEAIQVPTSPNNELLNEETDSVMIDCLERDTSEQLKQGVRKFCERYKMMTVQNFSDNRIASALNRFGWVFGGTVTSVQGGLLRRGRRIAVQATAAGRRLKTLSRGKSKAPSGRPLKKEAQTIRTKGDDLSRYHIPLRNLKPPKRSHSLSRNVTLRQQNAGKW